MRQRMRLAGLVALVVVVSLPLAGCEDSDLTAPTDGIINLAVNPSTIVVDTNSGETEATAQVIASVFDNGGKPLQNVSVLFSTGGGSLASSGSAVKTNASGIATDTLTVTSTSPATFKVQAQSSAIITNVDVNVTTTEPNEPPLASILEQPVGSAQIGQLVLFDGSTSLDPDGQITCYQWSINSTSDPDDELVQGTTTSALERVYSVEQSLSIVLRVSDRADAAPLCTYIGFGEWTATLEVCDDGNGTSLPNGKLDCQKCDQDETQVRIVNTDLATP